MNILPSGWWAGDLYAGSGGAPAGCCCPSVFPGGMRIFIPQRRHRTSFPRACTGTASTRWHDKLGHMIRMTLSVDTLNPRAARAMPVDISTSERLLDRHAANWSVDAHRCPT